jgi:hypothetical protein
LSGLHADQYEVAVRRLASDWGQTREQARATLERWDAEATGRGMTHDSPDYFKDVWRWMPALPPKG